MPRSTEQSYMEIREFLQSRRLPATINDMIEGNVLSRPTLFRLLRPESFGEAAVFGIRVLNNTKPFFFSYDENLILEMLDKVDPEASKDLKQTTAVLTGAAKIVAANSVVLDDLETRLIKEFREFRSKYNKDAVLRDNFKQPPISVANYINTIVEIREILEAEPLKFKSFILSTFVTLQNGD